VVKDIILDAIRFLEHCLKDKGLHVSKIILFGSHARGDAEEESDIDIAIVSEDFEGKNIFERAELTKEPEIMTIRKFMIPFDIVTLTPDEIENEKSLIASYAKEGNVIYAE